MKIRKNKKRYSWLVRPYSDKYMNKSFKYKSDAIKYLASMGWDALNSTISREVDTMNGFYTEYEEFVWFNQYKYERYLEDAKFVLSRQLFRGKKYIHSPKWGLSKSTVRYFTKSDQIINLMCYIANKYGDGGEPTDSNLKNLLNLFIYRFRKLPDDPDGYGEPINKLEDCEFWHWSDRCNYVRASVIVKCIRNEKPYLLENL